MALEYHSPCIIGDPHAMLPWFAVMFAAICIVGATLYLYARHIVGHRQPFRPRTGRVVDGAWSGAGQTCWYLLEADQGDMLLLRAFRNCTAPLEIGERVTVAYRGSAIQRCTRQG